MEEIQAESAAYYSYQTEDYQSDVGGGKIKTRRTKRICLYPEIGQGRTSEKGLDFEVLTLDEIRRRKRRKVVEEKESKGCTEVKGSTVKGESTTGFLKDAMKTLNDLKETISVRGVKRSLEDNQENNVRRKIKCNIDRTGTSIGNVPPVKLRRSPKRFTSFESEIEERRDVNEAEELGQMGEIEEESDETSRKFVETYSTDRLGNSENLESSNVPRKSEVEIRLCDSSTDEDQTLLEKKDERTSIGTYTVDDSKETCDSLLNIHEDEYLTLDMASDDILKDIDALLKEKSSV